MLERTARARRAILLLRLVSLGLAVFALGVIGAALRHAGNAFEAGLGLVVAIGIAAAWLVDARHQQHAHLGVAAPPREYLEIRRTLARRRVAFAHLGWIVAALDLAFLVPWWLGGLRVHGLGLTQLPTLWLPLAVILAFAIWLGRVRTRARAELEALARLASEA